MRRNIKKIIADYEICIYNFASRKALNRVQEFRNDKIDWYFTLKTEIYEEKSQLFSISKFWPPTQNLIGHWVS